LGAGLDHDLTGYENIINLALMIGLSLKKAHEIVQDVEEFTELGDFLSLPVRTYSSGMLMRLMFAVATSSEPDILLLDEMFSTGDAGFREKSIARIKSLIDKASIMFFASHDKALIQENCNKLMVFEHGKLIEITNF
jgi:ABC-type polysaccharide/polyol phosphate transport system ATPase subunit